MCKAKLLCQKPLCWAKPVCFWLSFIQLKFAGSHTEHSGGVALIPWWKEVRPYTHSFWCKALPSGSSQIPTTPPAFLHLFWFMVRFALCSSMLGNAHWWGTFPRFIHFGNAHSLVQWYATHNLDQTTTTTVHNVKSKGLAKLNKLCMESFQKAISSFLGGIFMNYKVPSTYTKKFIWVPYYMNNFEFIFKECFPFVFIHLHFLFYFNN